MTPKTLIRLNLLNLSVPDSSWGLPLIKTHICSVKTHIPPKLRLWRRSQSTSCPKGTQAQQPNKGFTAVQLKQNQGAAPQRVAVPTVPLPPAVVAHTVGHNSARARAQRHTPHTRTQPASGHTSVTRWERTRRRRRPRRRRRRTR